MYLLTSIMKLVIYIILITIDDAVGGRKLEDPEKTYVSRRMTTVPDHILPGVDRTRATHINEQTIITIKTMWK